MDSDFKILIKTTLWSLVLGVIYYIVSQKTGIDFVSLLAAGAFVFAVKADFQSRK